MFYRAITVGFLIMVATVLRSAETENNTVLEPRDHFPAVARQVVSILQRGHILQMPFDNRASARAWTNLLTILDYDRSYFVQSDIDRFEPMTFKIGDAIKAGDVSFAYDVFKTFRERLDERHTFVTNFLANPVDFSVDESYVWKRKQAVWPASREEQDDLWRCRLKNEYLGFIIARELDQVEGKTNRVAAAGVEEGQEAVAEAADNSDGVATEKMAGAEAAETPTVPEASTVELPADIMTNLANRAASLMAQTPEEFVGRRYQQFKIVIDDADSDWIFQRYMSAVAAAYDPHSDYLSPEKKEDFDIEMNLTLSGIGATLRPEDGAALVVDLIPGGPAARDARDIRLRPKDKIVGVGQGDGVVEDVLHLPLSKTVRKIRGKKGTKVVLMVVSGADPSGMSVRLVDLIRDDVKLEEQAATGRVERVTLADGSERALGVVVLPMFYGTMQRPGTPGFRSCAEDVAKEIARLNDHNIEGLLLDLRNNGGGSLREAVSLAALFLHSGPVVQVREAWQVQVLNLPPSGGPAFRKPVVVLVNRSSASASEIVAGALQDYGRAMIVGDSKTHGKGSVQSVLPLSGKNSGSIKLTSANYYRINGASTQLRGVVPDIVVPSLIDALDVGEDQLPNPLPWTRVDSTDFKQLFDMKPWVIAVKERVAERLAKSERYVSYSRLVQHIREMTQKTDVPLEYNARREVAQTEREMRKLQESVEGGGEAETKDGKKDDLILEEALLALSDLIDVSEGAEIPEKSQNTDFRALMLKVFGQE